MKIVKQLAILAAFGACALAACSSKTDASEKNFAAALTQYFDKKGELCLNIDRWPVELSKTELGMRGALPGGSANQMAVLEAAGLVLGEDAEVDIMGFMGHASGSKSKVRRYNLTSAAKPYAKEKDVETIGLNGRGTVKRTNLCWGSKALDKVIKWEGPMKFGDYQEANITYTYKLTQTADWAKRPDVQAAFPYVKAIFDGAGTREAKHAIKLTSQGWEAKGLD